MTDLLRSIYFIFLKISHRAFVGFFSGVPPHVHHQHVLSFEGFLVPRTVFPAANETFLVHVNVIVVYVFDQIVLRRKFHRAFFPVAIRFDEVGRFVFQIAAIGRFSRFSVSDSAFRFSFYSIILQLNEIATV